MTKLFLIILNMSVTAGLVIAVILAVRVAMYRAPRKYSLILWVAALFRLVCPVSLPSVLSLFRVGGGTSPVVVDAGAMSYRGVELLTPPAAGSTLGTQVSKALTNAAGLADAANGAAAAAGTPGVSSVNITHIIASLWIIGALAMLVYGALSYIRVKRRVATAVRLDGNVFESEAIRSPFVLGFVRPRIYIPFGLTDTPRGYILAHERHHIARGDHITKLLAFLTLAVHWFNPLVWLAFVLFSKDMEMSCDEHVLRSAAPGTKRAYSLTMIAVAMNRRFPVPSPIAFGESGVRGRIKNVLRFRRPKRWVSVTSALLCVLMVASCATNPLVPSSPSVTPPEIRGTEVSDYYPAHTDPNEADYTTILADPSLLKEGKSVLAVWEPPMVPSGKTYDQSSKGSLPYGYDMRSCDMTGIDITSITNVNRISFNSDTIWPKKLPDGFDPKRLLEFNKNPGLGIDDLHKQGITGEGVGVAIIGGALPSGHEAYAANLRYYERIHRLVGLPDSIGPWLAGIAVGQDTGVAPGADLYYIASLPLHRTADPAQVEIDMTIWADCILRVLEINRQLPEDRKIRVITMAGGYNFADLVPSVVEGTAAMHDAIAQAERENVFVVMADTKDHYKNLNKNLYMIEARRIDYLSDPDSFDSYGVPEMYDKPDTIIRFPSDNMIMVPGGVQALPDYTGETDYVLTPYTHLVLSSAWLAGFYALCCQVKPELTISEFIEVIYETGVPNKEYVGKLEFDFAKIINPAGVIAALKKS